MLTLPTRSFVGLLADVYPFASPDDEDSTWHRVVVGWDGARLYAHAGTSTRMAMMSWGKDDGDAPDTLPLDLGPANADEPWELAILPGDAKQIAQKFKVSASDGDWPVIVHGGMDHLKVRRDSDVAGVALSMAALARPWDDNAPNIPEQIGQVADRCRTAAPRTTVAYEGALIADFANPKVVRPAGLLRLHFAPGSTYIEIGRHFRGVVHNATEDTDG